ncbi:metallophosphoesterase, partial [Haloferula sargassicola]|uniref:metallophosphoesterase n=1 Tax=Haloferula sargassicola TaxID=490096 RepID=UPI0033658D07
MTHRCLALAALIAASSLQAAEPGASFKDHPHPPDVHLAEPPELEDPRAFSMIVLGDPQSYEKFDINQPIFELLTAWTAAQKRRLNVKTALCTGDLVEQNDLLTANGGTLYAGMNNGNQSSTQQWESVSRAFRRLDQVYPYILATGNHDYGYESAENRNSRFPDYFPPARNPLWASTLVATAPNAFGRPTLENAAYAFTDEIWGDLLVVVLEFAPRDEAIAWAAELISSEKYAGHQVILLTHSVLDTQGNLIATSPYRMSPRNEGAALMEKLIKPSTNIKLVICGH